MNFKNMELLPLMRKKLEKLFLKENGLKLNFGFRSLVSVGKVLVSYDIC